VDSESWEPQRLLSTQSLWGGEVIGVTPRQFLTYEPGGKPLQFRLGRIIIVDNIYEQKISMLRHSDASVILPGGFGTLEEIVAIRLWQRLGMSDVLTNIQLTIYSNTRGSQPVYCLA
jgi:predicted Rossmann-fold nucleotide-binding protein